MKQNSIKVWELSLLLSLCISLCWGVFESGRQTALSEKIVRLHVIASGNSVSEQELKKTVRDAVAQVLQPMMEKAKNARQAALLIEAGREDILAAACAAAKGEHVELIFGREVYPTRHAQGYALPAGEYTSLRIVIGEGEGHNWWGVIFPQLTPTEAFEQSESVALLDEEELRFVYNREDYEISFRILEILQQLRLWLK